jgi:acyl-CoA synthetase (AMP-forming)/AMP-acid ligase II
MDLSTLIAHHARYRPGEIAVVFGERHVTWRELGERTDRLAQVLLSLGIRPGDRVATLLPNCVELLEVYWACPRIGAVLVPLSPLLLPAGLASLLRDAGARCLVTDRDLCSRLLAPVRDQLDALADEAVLTVDGNYPSLLAAAPAGPPHTRRPAEEDLFNIMYTSGTTGLPKGIMHTHRIRAAYATLFAAAWRMTPESVVLHSGAIVFNGAFVTLMPCFFLGARYVLMPAFEAGAMIATVAKERATHVMVVPSQVVALLDHPDFTPEKLASLEMILSLGAPLPQERKDQLNRLLPGRFHELYGLTEGFVTILDKAEAVRKSGSVGRPPLFFEIRIVREDGSDAPRGEVGEIAGRGPILMTGYWNQPDLTAQSIRGGWLHSGDLGRLDEEGYLYLVDRKKDMIDSGGVKVYPKDVEEIAARHPAVAEVAVFGVPDDKWGETPMAAVVLKAPGAATAEELRDWINARVGARYQRVKEVALREAFPRNAAGKTLKRELREPYWAGKNRKI